MHHHHEVVLVGTSVGLPPSLQKPLGSCSCQVLGRQNILVRKSVLCKAVQFSEGDADISAVMASTVDHVWNDRGRNDRDGVHASSAATFSQLSVHEEQKVAHHAGWSFKRVRDHLLDSKQQFVAQGRSGPVKCTSTDLLLLLEALGDRLGQNGK